MSSPAEGPATVTLTDKDRDFAEYGCDGTGEYRRCHDMSERFEELVTVVAALTADLATARADFTASTEATMRALDERDSARQVIANFRALADDLHEQAQIHVNATPASRAYRDAYLSASGRVRALLPAAPTEEGS